MAIETRKAGNSVVVSVSGRLDAVTAPAYEKAVRGLVEDGATRMVVDFEQLDYISSAGLGELIVTLKLLKEKGGQLAVANVRGNVLSVFEMCGIQKLLGIHNSVADALAAVN
jgi:anti-anti-sigma factor